MCGNRRLSNGPASSYVKSSSEELHTRPYMVTKRRCVWIKTFPLGHFLLHYKAFIMFLYIREITTKASNDSLRWKSCPLLYRDFSIHWLPRYSGQDLMQELRRVSRGVYGPPHSGQCDSRNIKRTWLHVHQWVWCTVIPRHLLLGWLLQNDTSTTSKMQLSGSQRN